MPRSAVLIDIDGVLTVSWRPVDGAVEAFRRLRDSDLKLGLITNTTSVTRATLAARLTAVGFEVTQEEIITAPLLAADYIKEHHPNVGAVAVLNSGDIRDDLVGIDVVPLSASPGLIILGGAGPEFTYESLNRVFSLVDKGAALVALHRNLYWQTDDGLQLDTGAYLGALELATGREAPVVGKPSPEFFRAALQRIGAVASETAMIGDDIDNDILAAQAFGIRGVLVGTGKFKLPDRNKGPEVFVPSFANVPALFEIR